MVAAKKSKHHNLSKPLHQTQHVHIEKLYSNTNAANSVVKMYLMELFDQIKHTINLKKMTSFWMSTQKRGNGSNTTEKTIFMLCVNVFLSGLHQLLYESLSFDLYISDKGCFF